MTPSAFLDTNILIRYFMADNEDHSPRSDALIQRINAGELTVFMSDTVIFETVFVLQSRYGRQRSEISSALESLIAIEHLILPNREIYAEVLARWIREPSLSFADSYHLSLAKHLGLTEIISFDRKLGKDPVVRRVEP